MDGFNIIHKPKSTNALLLVVLLQYLQVKTRPEGLHLRKRKHGQSHLQALPIYTDDKYGLQVCLTGAGSPDRVHRSEPHFQVKLVAFTDNPFKCSIVPPGLI